MTGKNKYAYRARISEAKFWELVRGGVAYVIPAEPIPELFATDLDAGEISGQVPLQPPQPRRILAIL